MKTSKLFLLITAFMLLTSLSVRALGQVRTNTLPFTKVNAIEVSDGTLGYDQEKQEITFGYSFLGRTTGALPGSFTLSMNCTPSPQPPVTKGGLTDPIPPSIAITGGSWTLPVFMTGTEYAGSLYGTIAKGEMKWDQTGTTGNIYIVLNVDGGTQSWDGAHGYATFTGTLSVNEKTLKTTLSGGLLFNITPAAQVP